MAWRRKLDMSWSSDVFRTLLLGIAYYVAAQVSLLLALVEENITPLWPPTGIALVGFLVLGRRCWPGIAIAAVAVNLPISATPLAAAATAAGNTLAPVVAATLLLRTGFRPRLDRSRDALGIVFLAALLSMLISATIGAGALVVSGAIPEAQFPAAWSVWWAGDAMGVLVVAPFLLTVPSFRDHPLGGRIVEAVALLVALVSVSLLALTSEIQIMFVVLPLLGWAAWRFQQQGAAPAALLVSVLATWAAVEERGPFAGSTLLDKMLTLQVFNATVAFTSLFFAAIVSERMRSREALERAAAELEDRVRDRTMALSAANEQLGEAQALAHVGSWEWDLESGAVSWSPEMYRIHGIPADEGPVTIERAPELVVPEDRPRIKGNVARALEGGSTEIPDIEYRIARRDGSVRMLTGKARIMRSDDGSPDRMVGTVQDITERREIEREHRIANTLQRALLPERLPQIAGLELASRYVPAEEGSSAGGDWYDVIELPDGDLALVIGDVAGHGTQAASVMGQVRMAVRAYSVEGHPPKVVMGLINALLRSLYGGEQMVTMLYVVVNPVTLETTIVNAGHPPPLVLDPAGGAIYLGSPVGLPVGLSWDLPYEGSLVRLPADSTLVLFTDGIIDRRDMPVKDGLDLLRRAAAERVGLDVDALCGELLRTLVPADASDDVAILAARFAPAREELDLRVPADPAALGSVRRSVGRWLASLEVGKEEADDIVLACSEACANSMEHAYGPGGGSVHIEAAVRDGEITIVVRDTGSWRAPRSRERGRGLLVIEACMDGHTVTRGTSGTELRMRRTIRSRAPA
jgi:PAS domain S-box-containing protein